MLIVQPDTSVPITTENHGGLVIVGINSIHATGAAVLHFVDDGQLGKTPFAGSLTIMGCSSAAAALAFGTLVNPNPLLQLLPYRKIVINSTPSDYSFDSLGTPLTGSSIVQVPTSGLWVAVLVACTAGSGTLYNVNVMGAAAP